MGGKEGQRRSQPWAPSEARAPRITRPAAVAGGAEPHPTPSAHPAISSPLHLGLLHTQRRPLQTPATPPHHSLHYSTPSRSVLPSLHCLRVLVECRAPPAPLQPRPPALLLPSPLHSPPDCDDEAHLSGVVFGTTISHCSSFLFPSPSDYVLLLHLRCHRLPFLSPHRSAGEGRHRRSAAREEGPLARSPLLSRVADRCCAVDGAGWCRVQSSSFAVAAAVGLVTVAARSPYAAATERLRQRQRSG